MLKYRIHFSLAIFLLFSLSALRPSHETLKLPDGAKYNLSEYGFFRGNLADQLPADGVMPYKLNTSLFSDYARKLRFVTIPEGQAADYREREVLDFPVGTVLVKTFYYPDDMRKPQKGRRLLETRLLMHAEDGWHALPYVWNEEQTDATLEVTGGTKVVKWRHTNGKKRELAYSIPNINQCKGCHVKNQSIKPIGPTARQLNGNFHYAEGEANQLQYWKQENVLTGLPQASQIDRLAVWDDPTSGSLSQRARAYLDINCAHCHNEQAPANTSGLLLDYYQEDSTALGILKTPVAAGRGSGSRQYDVMPGHPKASIMWYRMSSTDPGEMMPEIGRKTVHEEGLALIEDWIKSLPTQ